MSDYLTQDDVDNYGPELINVTQRAALQAVTPHLANLEQQNAQLQQRLAVEARRNLDQRIAIAVPNYREIDRDPRWHRWLLGTDALTGLVRQHLLNDAIASGSDARVASFFRTFEREAGGAQAPAQAAQGRARASALSGKIYTRAEIAKLYRRHQQGAFNNREAEWARQEADIFAAQHEGRVLGGTDLHGK